MTLTEVKNLVKGGEFDELRVKMMQPLSFGTAGNQLWLLYRICATVVTSVASSHVIGWESSGVGWGAVFSGIG